MELARCEARPRRSRVHSALLTDGSERCRVPPVASRPGTCPTRALPARVNFCAAPLADFPTREGQAPVAVLGTNSASLQQVGGSVHPGAGGHSGDNFVPGRFLPKAVFSVCLSLSASRFLFLQSPVLEFPRKPLKIIHSGEPEFSVSVKPE